MALGRKNYLFAGSHEGAQRAAMMYSFLGTCKINEVEPFDWLSKVLNRIPDHSIQQLEELLPGNLKEYRAEIKVLFCYRSRRIRPEAYGERTGERIRVQLYPPLGAIDRRGLPGP